MPKDIEFHFDRNRGCLSVACDDATFARVRDRLITETGGEDHLGDAVSAVKMIVLGVQAVPPPVRRLQDRAWLLGCGLVGFCFLLVLFAGAIQIASWLR